MTAFAAAFWICVALIVYHHLVYPVLLHALARRRAQTNTPRADNSDYFPSVTWIVPCHNEAAVIKSKIANISGLDYPSTKLTVILALDGCTDDTAALARSAIEDVSGKFRWRIVEAAQNRGKVAVLNDQISQADSEIVALSDASALVSANALKQASAHFADHRIGVVCGTYLLGEGAYPGERAYWDYQRRLKSAEAAVAAPMGAHGAFYLFRHKLWTPMPADTINDDFILPMRIVLQGHNAVYDQFIVATEIEPTRLDQDFRRRVRIGAGNLQQLLRLAELGDPRRGLLALVFLSGKGLRALMPFILAFALVLSIPLWLYGNVIYTVVFFGELLIVALSVLGSREGLARRFPLAIRVSYVIVGHIASGWGAAQFLARSRADFWNDGRPTGGDTQPNLAPEQTLTTVR